MSKGNKKKKIVWQEYIALAFMMLIGGLCGFVMAMYIDNLGEGVPIEEIVLSVVLLFVGMYIAIFFHLIIHEAGHLIFGLLTGYRFSSFRIFSFMWLRENGRLRLKRLSVAGTGGQCLMSPPEIKDGKMPLVLYNLGGSLVNLIAAAVFFFAFLIFKTVPLVSTAMSIFAVVGLMIALMNGIPMRMGTVDNDGYNAFSLSKNKEAVEAFWVQLKAVEQTSMGVRLKDMPEEWFAVPTDEAMKNSMVATRGVFACNRLMDAEKFDEADALMAHLLEIESGIVGLHRSLLICDRMYIELIKENRTDVIDDMLTKEQKTFMRSMKNFPSVLRTEYTLALLRDKDTARAEEIKAGFEKSAKSYPYPHEVDSERELMDIAKRILSERN